MSSFINIFNADLENNKIYETYVADLLIDFKNRIEEEHIKGQRSIVLEIPTNIHVVNVKAHDAADEIIYRLVKELAKDKLRMQLLEENKILIVWFKSEDVLHAKKRAAILEWMKRPIDERFKNENMMTPSEEINEVERTLEETYYQHKTEQEKEN
jgi:hypothetical protein